MFQFYNQCRTNLGRKVSNLCLSTARNAVSNYFLVAQTAIVNQAVYFFSKSPNLVIPKRSRVVKFLVRMLKKSTCTNEMCVHNVFCIQ